MTDRTLFPDHIPVLVVGAGPTGLTASALLAEMDCPALTIDRREGLTPYSKALGVQARTLELFEKLGIAEAAVERGAPITRAEIFRDGDPIAELPLAEAGEGLSPYPYVLSLEQSRTEELLDEALRRRGGRVRWETELVSIELDSSGATARLRDRRGDEHVVRADWVVGADGASSPVRKATGQSFVGGTYAEEFMLVDAPLEGPISRDCVTLDLIEDGVMAFFPLPGEGAFRVIGTIPEELGEVDSLGGEELVEMVLERTSLELEAGAPRWSSTYRLHHRRAERFRVGRAFLVGDAAHVHSPAGGQGMNTGIGDAYNLCWKLARVVRERGADALLDTYAEEREPFAEALLAGTDRAFSIIASDDFGARLARRHGLPLMSKTVWRSQRFQREAFRRISQIAISYEDGRLAVGATPSNGPGPGARAPDCAWPGGGRLFDRLRASRHHLLVLPGPEAPERVEIDRALGELRPEVVWLEPGGPADELREVYGAPRGGVRLIRPDGYLGVVTHGDAAAVDLTRYVRVVRGADRAHQSSHEPIENHV